MYQKLSMKKRIILLSIFILLIIGAVSPTGTKYSRVIKSMVLSTFRPVGAPTRDSAAVAILQINYQRHRDTIEHNRKRLYKEYILAQTEKDKTKVLTRAGVYFKEALVNKIYPCWYGTEWDYNGITETPCKGKIACGYFVSTTLKHAGLNLNRYKLAQKYSHAIVKSVCTNVKVYNHYETMMASLENAPDNLYVIGLDNHVGIVSKESSEVFFIHSSFVYPSSVQKEPANESSVLGGSSIYVLGNLTANHDLLKAWLTGSAVKVVP
jgi:hypothetical protein